MKIRPWRTLPLRTRLRREAWVNGRARAGQPSVEDFASRATVSDQVSQWIRLSTFESSPHPYALLGHQVSNWVAGLLWTRDLGGVYVGGMLTRNDPATLALSDGSDRRTGRAVRLGAVRDERDASSLPILLDAVASAVERQRGPLHFVFSLDQLRFDQTPAAGALREAALTGSSAAEIIRLEAASPFIALHMRRGELNRELHGDRWVLPEWYLRVITQLREIDLVSDWPVKVFTQGEAPAQELRDVLGDVAEVIGSGTRESDFAHMMAAALLVPAPSSFSFSAALASRGAVVARHPWWHATPDEGRFAQVTHEGLLDVARVRRALDYAASTRGTAGEVV